MSASISPLPGRGLAAGAPTYAPTTRGASLASGAAPAFTQLLAGALRALTGAPEAAAEPESLPASTEPESAAPRTLAASAASAASIGARSPTAIPSARPPVEAGGPGTALPESRWLVLGPSGNPARALPPSTIRAPRAAAPGGDSLASGRAGSIPAQALMPRLELPELGAPGEQDTGDLPDATAADELLALASSIGPQATRGASGTSGRGNSPLDRVAAGDRIKERSSRPHGSVRVTSADAMTLVSDPSLLAPELRAALERVVGRMRDEYGLDVKVVETYRSQARQDQLFAQGRTTPGPIVTWTHDSRHGEGRAVDVVVDGGYGDPLAYARLQRIAGEEGLHTLGARDPGHLELPGRVHGSEESPTSRSDAAPSAMTAVPAAVARVATVAVVARIATPHVAEIATTRAALSAAVAASAPATQPLALPPRGSRLASRVAPHVVAARRSDDGAAPAGEGRNNAEPVAASAQALESARSTDGERERDRERRPSAPEIAPAPEPSPNAPAVAVPRVERSLTSVGGVERAPAAAAVDAARHVERALAAHEQAAARVPSHLVLRVDNAAGGEDRIRVDLRGSHVAATIDLQTAADAAALRPELPQLERALQQRGLEAGSLHVRGPADPREAAASLAGAADAPPPRDGPASPPQPSPASRDRERGAGHDTPRRDDSGSHQRPRRGRNGDQPR